MQSDTDYSISSNIKPSFFEEMIMKKNIFRLFVGTFVVPFYFYETKSLHIAFPCRLAPEFSMKANRIFDTVISIYIFYDFKLITTNLD